MHAAVKPEGAMYALFEAIDAMDAGRFAAFLTEDAEFRFGSAPMVSGRPGIVEAVQGFFTSIAGLSHSISKVWHEGSSLVCEGDVHYRRHDGSEIDIPFVDVFEFRGDLISQYKIYIDIGPLYAT